MMVASAVSMNAGRAGLLLAFAAPSAEFPCAAPRASVAQLPPACIAHALLGLGAPILCMAYATGCKCFGCLAVACTVKGLRA
jgi:hypothetical protein